MTRAQNDARLVLRFRSFVPQYAASIDELRNRTTSGFFSLTRTRDTSFPPKAGRAADCSSLDWRYWDDSSRRILAVTSECSNSGLCDDGCGMRDGCLCAAEQRARSRLRAADRPCLSRPERCVGGLADYLRDVCLLPSGDR